MHIIACMIEHLRSLFVVVEEGSLNRAAALLHVTQPSLTRRMQAFEAEIGGSLLERSSSGVQPTALGQAVLDGMRPVLGQYEAVLADLRRQARGQRSELRIGYIGSAAHTYLNPALAALRREHPEVKVKLLDLTPGEQVVALNQGKIDLALIGQEGAAVARDFYTLKLATLGVCVALSSDHPLASRRELHPADLKGEFFVGAPEAAVPGRNQWVARICRKGGFKPRFVVEADSIGEAFSFIASEGAVMLLPDYFASAPPSGTVLLPLIDDAAKWDLLLVWQRGKAPAVLKSMVSLMTRTARQKPGS